MNQNNGKNSLGLDSIFEDSKAPAIRSLKSFPLLEAAMMEVGFLEEYNLELLGWKGGRKRSMG